MSTYCQELNKKITYGEPFFIITRENMSGGAIVSLKAMNRVPLNDRLFEKKANSDEVNVYSAKSSWSKDDSYSWFNIIQEEYLFSFTEEVFDKFFPNCKIIFKGSD
jgi:hypothetical protein